MVFGISRQRLACLRNVKREMSQHPVVDMTKEEAEEQRLGDFVIMPVGTVTAFMMWWRGLSSSTVVQVRYPDDRHGNAGKVSHAAKTSILQDFLTFVDTNSQPNGRSSDLSGPTYYFLPKFTTLQTPKVGSSHYEERLSRDLWSKSSIVPRENVAEVLAAMVLPIIG